MTDVPSGQRVEITYLHIIAPLAGPPGNTIAYSDDDVKEVAEGPARKRDAVRTGAVAVWEGGAHWVIAENPHRKYDLSAAKLLAEAILEFEGK